MTFHPGAAPTPAELFADAGRALAELAAAVPADAWDRPGLGQWTVRDLVGHAGRALSTVEDYLAAAPGNGPSVPDALTYYGFARGVDPSAIAERGRAAGQALGDDPAAAVAALVDRVLALVATTAHDATVTLAAGASMALSDYLVTRVFELAVHGLDIARAIGAEPPPVLDAPVRASTVLAGKLAARSDATADVLLALTGRQPLPPGWSVI